MTTALTRAPWRSALRLRGVLYRSNHDGFSAMNVFKDPSKAPVEKVRCARCDYMHFQAN